jgi:hydrogenase maturation protease
VNGQPPSPAAGDILVIGFGSTLRSDDGVGPRVAERIGQQHLTGVQTIGCHQLTPELADPIARSRAVIFADAAVDLPTVEVRVTPLEPEAQRQAMLHTASPAALLYLAQSVFGHCPPAWLVAIPVSELGIGEELSAVAQRGVRQAVQRIEELIRALSGTGRVAGPGFGSDV